MTILPVVSKIIEAVIFKQLYEYLTHNNFLAGSQHGFRPMHSTLTSLLETTNNWYLRVRPWVHQAGVLHPFSPLSTLIRKMTNWFIVCISKSSLNPIATQNEGNLKNFSDVSKSSFSVILINNYSPKAKLILLNYPRDEGDYSTIVTEPVLVYSHEVISTESERKPLKND